MSLSEHVFQEEDLADKSGGVAARSSSAQRTDGISATKAEVSCHDNQTSGQDNPTDDFSWNESCIRLGQTYVIKTQCG